MKERPIIFSAPMVRAILAGTKVQTRRVVKPQAMGQWGPVVPCPYGQPGDRLWVREAWKAHTTFDHLPPREIPQSHVWYMADDGYKAESRYRKGMFMPRWASRILLDVTAVRVERLQDISESDAVAEGVRSVQCADLGHEVPYYRSLFEPRDLYRMVWESINGPGTWDANPWVWVVEFKRLTP